MGGDSRSQGRTLERVVERVHGPFIASLTCWVIRRFDRHLRRMRENYRARRDVLAAETENAFGPGRLQVLAAGCHAVRRLPDGASESAVVATAATMGLMVRPSAQDC
jgi:DNA-binding transcriptional MocR family regulator